MSSAVKNFLLFGQPEPPPPARAKSRSSFSRLPPTANRVFITPIITRLLTAALLAVVFHTSHAADSVLDAKRSSATGPVNLTDEGTLDWVHWGLIEADNMVNRKKTSRPLISDLKKFGHREIHTYVPTVHYSWTDGQPTAEAKTRRAVFVYAPTNGFELVFPADIRLREVKAYCGLWLMDARLDVKLGDGALTYTDSVGSRDLKGGHYVYTIRYRAKSLGENLTFRWMNVKGGGNVTMEAATLAEVKE